MRCPGPSSDVKDRETLLSPSRDHKANLSFPTITPFDLLVSSPRISHPGMRPHKHSCYAAAPGAMRRGLVIQVWVWVLTADSGHRDRTLFSEDSQFLLPANTTSGISFLTAASIIRPTRPTPPDPTASSHPHSFTPCPLSLSLQAHARPRTLRYSLTHPAHNSSPTATTKAEYLKTFTFTIVRLGQGPTSADCGEVNTAIYQKASGLDLL